MKHLEPFLKTWQRSKVSDTEPANITLVVTCAPDKLTTLYKLFDYYGFVYVTQEVQDENTEVWVIETSESIDDASQDLIDDINDERQNEGLPDIPEHLITCQNDVTFKYPRVIVQYEIK